MGEGRIDKSHLGRYSADETFDTGEDTGSPVSSEYQSPFRFTGTLKKVEIDTAPANFTAEDREILRKADQETEMAIE